MSGLQTFLAQQIARIDRALVEQAARNAEADHIPWPIVAATGFGPSGAIAAGAPLPEL